MTTTNLTEAQRRAVVWMYENNCRMGNFAVHQLAMPVRDYRTRRALLNRGLFRTVGYHPSVYWQLHPLGVELAERIIKEQEGGGG